jgi:hypothetical protein
MLECHRMAQIGLFLSVYEYPYQYMDILISFKK